MAQSPIPLAIIGLSSSAATSWASSAHLPYLLSPLGRQKYNIIALLNSSVSSAREAIAHYNLPASTRAYGNPHDLAADPDVRLVVCATRVDKHDATTRPSIQAGKDVIIEWPLAENAGIARELASLAAEKKVRAAVGLQGRVAPIYKKVAEILDSGRIGKVVSSEVRASGGSIDARVLPVGLKYFAQKEVGGNIITIGFGHLSDSIQHILGVIQSPSSTTQIRYPDVKIRGPEGTIIEIIKSDVPDLIVVSGALPGTSRVVEGATLSIRFRRGAAFKDEPGLVWTIEGEKGELRLVAPSGPAVQAVFSKPISIEVHDYATDEVAPIEWAWYDWQEELPIASRNIGALYEAFAEGGGYATFQDALERHEQIDNLLGS
ncbi:related to transcription co-repressor GAL80 [Cephalotrichum gorgonifer]|uniref:Related to transcription co-repressor GAL80 n=1 Tax=Cephalotrichum gorgonifer TaxID=2041049 RepID=A0AAE8MY09_9PEZI|nr:related to transcription co-repressor GAL80 [Cephalotrichum gorgonifer]